MIGDQQKIIFVVCHGRDAALANSIFRELRNRGLERNFLAVSTGKLGKEEFEQGPEETLEELGIPFRRLQNYGTKDISRILKREQAGIVLLTDDQEFIRRAFLLASNGLGIQNLLLSHLFISSLPRKNVLFSLKGSLYRVTHNFGNIIVKYLYVLTTAQHLGWGICRILKMIASDFWIAVSVYDATLTYGGQAFTAASSRHKEALMERGIDANRIFVTGNPNYDFVIYEARDDTINTSFRRTLGINRDDKVILFLTSAQVEHGYWTSDMRREFICGAVTTLSPVLSNSVRLVIKIHPLEDLNEYHQMLASYNKDVILLKDVNLFSIINIADVVVASYSVTIFDACVLRKPAIFLHIFNEPEYVPYVRMGIATGVYKLPKLRSAVEELLNNSHARNEALRKVDLFLGNNRQLLDGKASFRIVDLIFKLMAARGAS